MEQRATKLPKMDSPFGKLGDRRLLCGVLFFSFLCSPFALSRHVDFGQNLNSPHAAILPPEPPRAANKSFERQAGEIRRLSTAGLATQTRQQAIRKIERSLAVNEHGQLQVVVRAPAIHDESAVLAAAEEIRSAGTEGQKRKYKPFDFNSAVRAELSRAKASPKMSHRYNSLPVTSVVGRLAVPSRPVVYANEGAADDDERHKAEVVGKLTLAALDAEKHAPRDKKEEIELSVWERLKEITRSPWGLVEDFAKKYDQLVQEVVHRSPRRTMQAEETAVGSSPPAEGSSPPAEGSSPPAEGSSPPAEGSSPPAK